MSPLLLLYASGSNGRYPQANWEQLKSHRFQKNKSREKLRSTIWSNICAVDCSLWTTVSLWPISCYMRIPMLPGKVGMTWRSGPQYLHGAVGSNRLQVTVRCPRKDCYDSVRDGQQRHQEKEGVIGLAIGKSLADEKRLGY